MQSEIKRWGNSAAVRLPSKILAQANLDVSSRISIDVEAGVILIKPANPVAANSKLPFSEADLLVGLDAHGAHADELITPARGEWEV